MHDPNTVAEGDYGPEPREHGVPGPVVDGQFPSVTVCAENEECGFYTWLQFQIDDDYDLYLEMLSDLADVNWPEYWPNWIEFEREYVGWEFLPGLIGAHRDEMPNVKGALTLGVAPGQAFLLCIRGSYTHWRDYDYGGWETDLKCRWTLVAVESISPMQILENWQAWGKKVMQLDESTRKGGVAPWITHPVLGICRR